MWSNSHDEHKTLGYGISPGYAICITVDLRIRRYEAVAGAGHRRSSYTWKRRIRALRLLRPNTRTHITRSRAFNPEMIKVYARCVTKSAVIAAVFKVYTLRRPYK